MSDPIEYPVVSLLLTPVVAFGVILFLFVLLATGVWVNFDAHARGSAYPAFWGVITPLSGIVLLYYLLWWRRGRSRRYPPSRWERSAAAVVVAGLGGLIASAVLSPPDPVTQMTVWPVAFACCLPVAYWLVTKRFGTTGRSLING
jgi:uncharacterized membrane protein HdeD (DUF308 family)